MLTMLKVVSGRDDKRVAAMLRRAPARLTEEFLRSLNEADRQACGRYGTRMAIIALRTRSAELLADALLAESLSGEFYFDWRDSMVSLAVHHVVASELGLSPAALFDAAADRLPPGDLADHLRLFGHRSNITLAKFGHELVQTPDGPDLIPAGTAGRLRRQDEEPPDSPLAANSGLQALGHQVATRLGNIARRANLDWTWSNGRTLTNLAGWNQNLRDPDSTLPVTSQGLPPLLVRASFTLSPPHDTVGVVAALVDRQRSKYSGLVSYHGLANPDWTAQAANPANALTAVASRMTYFKGVTANRGDVTTGVGIYDEDNQPLMLAAGQGNALPRPATEADFQRLRDLTAQILDALANASRGDQGQGPVSS